MIKHTFLAAVLSYAIMALAAEPETASTRADALLARMTTEEKISQLVLFTGYGAVTGPVKEQQALEEHIRQGDCGNVFNVMSVAQVRKLQKIAVEESRLHIPLLFGYDVIHGYKTIFPICLGEAASWNPALIESAAHVAATEGVAEGGVRPTLFIHKRCARLIETLPALQHDPNRPEDVLKVDADEEGVGGDDAADALRYLVATKSRSVVTRKLRGL